MNSLKPAKMKVVVIFLNSVFCEKLSTHVVYPCRSKRDFTSNHNNR